MTPLKIFLCSQKVNETTADVFGGGEQYTMEKMTPAQLKSYANAVGAYFVSQYMTPVIKELPFKDYFKKFIMILSSFDYDDYVHCELSSFFFCKLCCEDFSFFLLVFLIRLM